MKYFTKILWEQCNSTDSIVRKKASKEWDENAQKNFKQYKNIRKSISFEFIKIYEKEYGFHDWKIEKIEASMKSNKLFSIFLTKGERKVIINYGDVLMFDVVVANCIEEDQWGYAEFSITNDSYIKHEILMLSGTIISITFKDISVESL
jgi:hypothetical protein